MQKKSYNRKDEEAAKKGPNESMSRFTLFFSTENFFSNKDLFVDQIALLGFVADGNTAKTGLCQSKASKSFNCIESAIPFRCVGGKIQSVTTATAY